ncbi:MAG: tannase/feruloyl esterase family alpha/beta hydrolase [Alphaproteobacteria bacterium]|nr:tannase/feruloyl esterase family alpha/beta hydrolase [Alphaproteobacteria bacterium]
MLSALAGWVEAGKAPADLQVIEQPNRPPFAATRSRPLCEWPSWPRYRSGDATAAASFECARRSWRSG